MAQEPEIIHEDSNLVVFNKPAGLTVNTSNTTKNEITLQDFATKKIDFTQNLTDSDFKSRGG